MRQLCKGNVAIVKGAILAGCRSYYGYPITPASEIAEAAALLLPQVDGTFLQAESEVAAINMVYGAAAAGARVMTASSGPGLSLMQEGISYLCGRRAALRHRRCHARRPWPRQHRPRTERLFRHGQRRRPRLLSQSRSRSRLRAGDGRPHHARLRSGRQVPQSRRSFSPTASSAR